MRYRIMTICAVIIITFVAEYNTLSNVEQVRWVNAFIEATIASLAAYLFIWTKPVVSKKVSISLDIGFLLFFISMLVDSLDQFFIHGEKYTALFEKVTLIIGIAFIINGLGKWYSLSQELNHKLTEKSITDVLTGVLNRRGIMRKLKELTKFKSTVPYSFLIMDIDDFKLINDNYGHMVGDRTLQKLGGYLNSLSKENWEAGRWGGEEFVIFLKNTEIHEAQKMAESIRRSVQLINPLREVDAFKFTVSLGVAQYNKRDKSFLKTIGRADQYMYQAKKSGKNKVVSELDMNFDQHIQSELSVVA